MITASAVLAESSDINIRGAGLGLVGGLVFTGIVIAVIFLVRNMNMRIKRLPDNFEDVPRTSEPAAEANPPVAEGGSDDARGDGA